MQNIKNTTTEANDKNNIDLDRKRKRVNRIKVAIIILFIILLILPTILCIILGIQVNRLKNQMRDLIEIHSQYGLTYEETDHINYAYAAEKRSDHSKDTDDVVNNQIANSQIVIPQIVIPQIANPQISTPQIVQALGDSAQTFIAQSDRTLSSKDVNQDQVKDKSIQTETESSILSEIIMDEQTNNTVSTPGIYDGKKVYLTFDDGPSIYTDKILDILAEYNVKATFFVIGKTDEESKQIYRRIVEEEHTLGMHSYSHEYDKIYNSIEDFDKDFTKLWKLLYDTTGYKPSIFRFPGGSNNQVNKNGMDKFINYLNEASIVYFDWNVLNGDATGVAYSKDQLIVNVLSGVAKKTRSIVLLHDSQSKKTTVESLPGLLKELIAGGAEILPLDQDVTPIQMIKANSND